MRDTINVKKGSVCIDDANNNGLSNFFVYLSIYRFISLIYIFISFFIYLFIYLFTYLFIYLQSTLLRMKRLKKSESLIFVIFCVLCFKRQPLIFLFYFTAAGDLKMFPVLHHSADYISISFGIIQSILVTLKIEYRLSWS